MKRVLLALALILTLAAPASADCIARSLLAFNAWQVADAYTISKYRWEGDPWYDQVMPMCDQGLARELLCQGVLYAIVRKLEKPSKGTCIANYIAAAALTIYTRRAFQVQLLGSRF